MVFPAKVRHGPKRRQQPQRWAEADKCRGGQLPAEEGSQSTRWQQPWPGFPRRASVVRRLVIVPPGFGYSCGGHNVGFVGPNRLLPHAHAHARQQNKGGGGATITWLRDLNSEREHSL